MPLKLNVTSLDQIEEPYRPLYHPVEGHPDEFVLDIEDAVPKAKLEEFRRNNLKLNEDMEKMRKQFRDIDPEEYRRRGTEIETLKEQAASKQTKGEKEYAAQMSQMAATHKAEKEAIAATLKEKDLMIARMMIDDTVTRLAAEAKALGPAIVDVVNRAKSVFRMEEGVVVAYRPTGEKWFSPESGNLLTVSEWIKLLPKECPHFFPANEGTRASGSANGAGGNGAGGAAGRAGGKNPFATTSWNRTEQSKLIKSNPALARQLADEAGAKIPGFN
jgi:hypothetical protein